MRWEIKIGRIYIILEVSFMYTHLALPLIGHLEHLYHVFGLPKAKPKMKFSFDPSHPEISENMFQEYYWQYFY